MKIFGSTQYVKVEPDGNSIVSYIDVKPLELYLQLEVKSQWDWNPNRFFLVFYDKFSYYVILESKETNSTYHSYKKLTEDEMTEEYKQLVNDYLKL